VGSQARSALFLSPLSFWASKKKGARFSEAKEKSKKF
jgi:hypothetical protein